MPVRVADIVPNPNQPRKDFNEEALKKIADSLRKYGMIHPVVVQRKGRKYEIVAGERRWRGAKRAGLKAIPATVRESLTEEEAKIVSLIENLCREDLNGIEEAEAYQEFRKHGWTEERIAELVGKTQSYIAHRLALLKLPKEVKELIIRCGIPASHAEELCREEDHDRQKKLVEEVVEKGISCKQLRERISRVRTPPRPEPSEPKIRCKLHKLVVELLKAVETGCDWRGNCSRCQLARKCPEIKGALEGVWT